MIISRLLHIIWFAALLILLALGAQAGQLTKTKPEEVGLSTERLAHLDQVMRDYVNDNKLAGVVTLIARRGKIAHLSAIGKMSLETGEAIKEDSIFRIYSMTKPITSVALLMLYEEGRFQLSDPVESHIPAFKDLKVFDGLNEKSEMHLVPQTRKMTILDVFRHTAGLSYGNSMTPVDKAYIKAGFHSQHMKLKDFVEKLGTLPLLYQPGMRWEYSYSHDVQAYLVEHFSGMDFDDFLRTRIFEPLGMNDTSFGLHKKKIGRFCALYKLKDYKGVRYNPSPLSPGIVPVEEQKGMEYLKRIDYPAGGTGLVSTAEDYFRFSQMLLNGGEFNGVRLLKPKTVELMTMDHLPKGVTNTMLDGRGYGLGVSILLDPTKTRIPGSIGQFGWAGASTTLVTIDPDKEMVSILMTQYFPFSMALVREFQTIAYQAIID